MNPLRGGVFPLTMVAFAFIGTKYIGFAFTTTTRWLYLAALLVLIGQRGLLLAPLGSPIGAVLYTYCAWGLVTAAWSPVMDLSLMKALASLLVTTAFVAGGYYWLELRRTASPLVHLMPITALALAAGFLGSGSTALGTYRGLTGNSNHLGYIAAVGTAYVFYRTYLAFSGGVFLAKAVTGVLVMAFAMILWLAASRSSVLCAVVIAASGFFALRLGRQAMIGATVAVAVAAALAITPTLSESVYERLVIKNETTPDSVGGSDILNSRRGPWTESYEAALEGGLLGLGYGVSAGHTEFARGLTAQTYGREKGNSQLAIVEEIGLVGLAIYALLLIQIVRTLVGGIRAAPDPETRVAMSLVLGTLVGLLCQSVFEAWWTAPGSGESALFWATVGVGLSYARRLAAEAQSDAMVDEEGVPEPDLQVPRSA